MKRSITLFCTLLLLIVSAVPALASKVLADIEYFYADDGTLIGKAFNGKRVNFEYDLRGQLLAVKDAQGKDLERPLLIRFHKQMVFVQHSVFQRKTPDLRARQTQSKQKPPKREKVPADGGFSEINRKVLLFLFVFFS